MIDKLAAILYPLSSVLPRYVWLNKFKEKHFLDLRSTPLENRVRYFLFSVAYLYSGYLMKS